METIVSDIARNHMEKDVNSALKIYGLFVMSIKFDSSTGFSVIIELGAHDSSKYGVAKNIAVPGGTAC